MCVCDKECASHARKDGRHFHLGPFPQTPFKKAGAKSPLLDMVFSLVSYR